MIYVLEGNNKVVQLGKGGCIKKTYALSEFELIEEDNRIELEKEKADDNEIVLTVNR